MRREHKVRVHLFSRDSLSEVDAGDEPGIKDRPPFDLKTEAQGCVAEWKTILRLAGWAINVEVGEMPTALPDHASASVSWDKARQEAMVHLPADAIARVRAEQPIAPEADSAIAEMLVVHELLHLLAAGPTTSLERQLEAVIGDAENPLARPVWLELDAYREHWIEALTAVLLTEVGRASAR